MSVQRTESSAWLSTKSHRTGPEQLVGLGIYLAISLAFELGTQITTHFWGTLYFFFMALSMWILWRSHSLRLLKLELSLYLSQFFFQTAWSVSYFLLDEPLLSLVSLLLLATSTLLSGLLFWKKEPLSGALLLFPFLWTFYLAGVYMITCMRLL